MISTNKSKLSVNNSTVKMLRTMLWEDKTGYTINTAYSLPRIKDTLIVHNKIFPYFVVDEKEALDRFGDLEIATVNTMLPVEKGKDYESYFRVYMRKADIAVANDVIVTFGAFFKKRSKLNVFTLMYKHYLKEWEKYLGGNYEKYHQAMIHIRTLINNDFNKSMRRCKFEEKYKNLALGMIRYKIGIKLCDINGD